MVHSQRSLETNNNELEFWPTMAPDICGDTGDIGVVQSGVNLIQDEERRRLETTKKNV